MMQFDTFFFVELLRHIFQMVDKTSVALQGVQLHFSKGQEIISTLKDALLGMKDQARFDTFWNVCTSSATLHGTKQQSFIDVLVLSLVYLKKDCSLAKIDDPFIPRARRSHPSHGGDPKKYFEDQYFQLLDVVIKNLQGQFIESPAVCLVVAVEDFFLNGNEDAFQRVQTRHVFLQKGMLEHSFLWR